MGLLRTQNKLKDILTRLILGLNPQLALNVVVSDAVFQQYIDNDFSGAETVAKLLNFLYNYYFLRLAQGKITLSLGKCRFFIENLKILRFEQSVEGIQPSVDKVAVIRDYLTLTIEKELSYFLALLLYIKDSCLGRADLSIAMRRAVQQEIQLQTINGKRWRVKTDLRFVQDDKCQKAFELAKKGIVDIVQSSRDKKV